MATFKHIKFGDGLTVIDEGANVITVNSAGGPPGPTGPAGATGATGPAGAPAYPTPVVNGQWVKGVGGAPVWAAITEADVTNLVTDLAGKQATSEKAAANGYASLDATAKVPFAQLPTSELAYAEITADVSVPVVAEASAVLVVTGPALTFDGSTTVIVEFQAGRVETGTGSGTATVLNLYDASTNLGLIGSVQNPATTGPMGAPFNRSRRLTPTAGSHTYKIVAWAAAAAGFVRAGNGGAGVNLPAFIRIRRI